MNKITSKYGIIAVEAACAASKGVHPEMAWKASAAKIFPNSPASEHKGCPKSAFLGLAELGEIAGVKSKSIDNKRYADSTPKCNSFSITRLKPPASSRLALTDKMTRFEVCRGIQVW